MIKKIDWERFENGQKQLIVEGIASTEDRKKLVGEAIGLIFTDPKTALKNEYIGYKNYAGFGDQRFDCPYGMGPRHGSIVFSIERSSLYDENSNHEDKIYFLKCFRDAIGFIRRVNHYETTIDNIQEVYRRKIEYEKKSALLQEFLDGIVVDDEDFDIC